MLPKLLLPLLLALEIFIFNQIRIFYACLILLIIPVIFRYIYHTLHCFYIHKLDYINNSLDVFVEKKIENVLHNEKIINNGAHYYIQEMVLYQLKIKKDIEDFTFVLKNNIKPQDFSWKESLTPLFKYYRTLYVYTMHKKHYDFYLNAFSLSIYCFCWFYILLTADTMLITFDLLTFLKDFNDSADPFSFVNM